MNDGSAHPPPPEEDVPFWQPDWSEVAVAMGWRWIYFLPAATTLVLVVLSPLYWQVAINFMLPLWKVAVFFVVLATGAAVRAIHTVVQRRTEPFCIHCGYTLVGLPDGSNCPECGREFTLARIDDYRRDPHWYAKRWKMRATLPPQDVPFMAGAVRRAKRSRDGT